MEKMQGGVLIILGQHTFLAWKTHNPQHCEAKNKTKITK